MDNVLTLIANPANTVLDDNTVSAARRALTSLNVDTAPADWLAPGQAVDIAFSATSFLAVETCVRQALNGQALDVIAQSAYRRKKKLLIADMDSTIVTGETLDELAAFAGLKDKIAAITQRAMQGELDFASALRERVAMLGGLDESFLAQTMSGIKLTPGAEALIATMRANGAVTALISGGFSYFTDRVRQRVGFDSSLGNQLGIKDGKLTGQVIPPIVDKDTKLNMLTDTAEQLGLGMSDTMAIGDGANDVPMLTAAGLGIAFHAHPIARQAARARLNYADLTGALFVQGYRLDEFAT
ncbi:MAG: phosphoserine phosphatase SerB [Rhodospirillales bacterium]|nr:phosphoserine phosphatase SerB [Rhodospirillales bacterium]